MPEENRWVLVLVEPGPSKPPVAWTGGVRFDAGEFVPETTDDIAKGWRFPTREEAVTTRESYFETFDPCPELCRFKPVELPMGLAVMTTGVNFGKPAAPGYGGSWP